MRISAALILFLLLFPFAAQAQHAEATIGTLTGEAFGDSTPVQSLAFTATSNATGDVVVTVSRVRGYVARLVFDPIESASPSAAWDITVTDVDGVTLYTNAAMSATATLSTVPATGTYFQVYVDGIVTLTFSNCGNAKKIRSRIYWDGD